MSEPTPSRHNKSLLALSLALLATAVTAQTRAPDPIDSTRAALPTQLQYRSALSGYRPYADQSMQSWREANDKVGQIGGWRAYAKESTAGESTQETPAVDTHSGHHSGAKP